jgi:hypothetical protein
MRALRSVLLSCALLSLSAAVAHAAPPGGTLVITDAAMDPKSPTFEKDLKKATKTSLTKSGDGWHLYFVAYLKKAAGSAEVNIVFYDVTAKREQINAFPINTAPSAKILMSDIEITPEQGFKAGHKYEVRITRLVGGKEDVYAKATLDLK